MVELAFVAGCLLLGTDPALVTAIVGQESSGRVSAFNINRWSGERFETESVAEAAAAARAFVAHGYTVDVGLAGINSRNLERFGVPIAEAFEPCTNLQLGERILVEGRERAMALGHTGDAALRVALSFYNTGSAHRGFDNGYVEAVWRRYGRHVALAAARAPMDIGLASGVSPATAPGLAGMSVPWPPRPVANPAPESAP